MYREQAVAKAEGFLETAADLADREVGVLRHSHAAASPQTEHADRMLARAQLYATIGHAYAMLAPQLPPEPAG